MELEEVKIVSLQRLLEEADDNKKIISILKTFKSNHNKDVEFFLQEKSIEYEKAGLSTTHLVFSKNYDLLGYFSFANKPLLIPKKIFEDLSKNQRKKLSQSGKKLTTDGYIVNSYLLGQLGKNYSKEIKKEERIDGMQLLTLAYDMLVKVKRIVNIKYIWLECEDNEKLVSFYKNFGFDEVRNFISENNLKVLIIRIKDK